MDTPTRVLFLSSEVEPFASVSSMGQVIRDLPEQLQESGDFECRIMMPRYGIISERRNRLHGVIRLSGEKIAVGEESDELDVKVASIPGIRLQVYFMDSVKYFKRKGVYEDREGKLFEDNAHRAAFFARAALQTTTNLGWIPDVVHCHGWISSLVPYVLRTEFENSPIFGAAKTVYSGDGIDLDDAITKENAGDLSLPYDSKMSRNKITRLGNVFADASVIGSGIKPAVRGATRLSGSAENIFEQALEVYKALLEERAAA